MSKLRITRRYLRWRSGIALSIVLAAAITAMWVALIGRDTVATRNQNTASVDTLLLSLSEMSMAFQELRMAPVSQRGKNSSAHVRRAAHAAEEAAERISQERTLKTFSPEGQSILRRDAMNPLLELEDVLFLAEVAVDPRQNMTDVARAAGMAGDLSMRLLPIFNRIKQAERAAAQEAADTQVAYGIFALVITMVGVGLAARFVLLPMERFVIRAQSEIEHNQRKAEAASEAKSMFLATMSHEIRTPLNGVLGLADVLTGTPLDKEQGRMVAMIKSSGQALLQLINDVLDLAKIEAGKVELSYEAFDVQALCQETAELFSGQAAQKGVTLTVHAAPNEAGWFVHSAPQALRQVLANLVGNAVKFTEQGTIELHLEDVAPSQGEERRLRIAVKDDGIGIAPNALERIFDQFEQADSSTTTQFGGTGLGLSIVQRMSEALGGHVRVESALNEGSEFILELPVGTAQQEVVVPTQHETVHFGKRVLVADDNRVNQVVARKILETLGCEVSFAANGLEAVDRAANWNPDLILMDVRMPMMDGLQATRAIRADTRHKAALVPIVGLSANAQTEHREAASEAGMSGYVQKPVTRSALKTELLRHWPAVTHEQEDGAWA
ncbi:ATP-binding protein [Shimia sagamensis]|uniref:histidine kinase n=1 Tax=Shimia sagamensis TaxID=1566352 RepID=A0ABY1N701_9RHOB|nr:ATP-binding protein [Shimia sagamensis]SMP01946.1 Signal transduction histidine kinase [Shimia sagamensis]